MWTNNKALKIECCYQNDCIQIELICRGVIIELNDTTLDLGSNLQVRLNNISSISLPSYYSKKFSLQPKHNAPIELYADNKEQAEMFAKEFMEAYGVEYTLVESK